MTDDAAAGSDPERVKADGSVRTYARLSQSRDYPEGIPADVLHGFSPLPSQSRTRGDPSSARADEAGRHLSELELARTGGHDRIGGGKCAQLVLVLGLDDSEAP
jgi:hypothetical protein